MAEQDTPVQTEAGADNPPAGSAPATDQSHVTGGSSETPPKSQPPAKGGVLGDLFKARAGKKEATARADSFESQYLASNKRNEELQARLDAQADAGGISDGTESQPVPQAFSKDEAKEAAREVYKEQLIAQDDEMSAAEAVNWLRTRKHLESDPNAETEIAEMVKQAKAEDEYYGRTTSSVRLAKSVYYDWCEAKGLTPDQTKASQVSANRASSDVSASASGSSGGQKTYSPKDVESLFKGLNPGSAEYKQAIAEVTKAQSEGRIKTK